MSTSSLLLLGIGGAGTTMVREIHRAFPSFANIHAVDTDASSGIDSDIPFTLIGGSRLAGRGAGGQVSEARAAFQDDPAVLDTLLNNVRVCVILTALGGGTGTGTTGEILKRIHARGVSTLLFATLPFNFEGADREHTAKAELGTLERQADVSVFLPCDDLTATAGTDNMAEALRHARNTVSMGVTLLWHLLEKPGYINFDAERLHTLLSGAGHARFACASAQGPERTTQVLSQLAANPLLARGTGHAPVRTIMTGILAGDDLRLSEVASIAGGLSAAFGPTAHLELGTVNDEQNFSGTLTVVTLLFEESATTTTTRPTAASTRRNERALAGFNRFGNADKTIWEGEDLDIPTYLRRNLTLEH